MSIFKDDKERKEFYTTRDKKEDNSVVEPKAKTKSIYDLKTIDELLEYYYLIPKIVEIDNYKDLNIRDVLEQITLKTRKPTNLNIVKRGKKHKKLTKEQEKEIRQSNLSNAKLSKIYNVSTTTIFRIKHKEE